MRGSPLHQRFSRDVDRAEQSRVRRFITEVLVGGQVELVDELLAANYVNRGMGGLDRAGFKAFLTAASAGPGSRAHEQELTLAGWYAPPGGQLGLVADRVLLHIAATGTARWLLSEIEKAAAGNDR